MKSMNWHFFGVIIGLVLKLVCTPVCRAAEPYHFLREIPVGGEEGWSLPVIDAATRRLYVPRESYISIIDLDKEQQVDEITNTPGVFSFTVCPKSPIGCFCSKNENMMRVVDLASHRIIAKAATGTNPVAVVFNTTLMEVYAFDVGENSARIYESDDGDFMGSLRLPGKPVSAVFDPKAERFFCSIGDQNEIVVIDARTHTVTNIWSTFPGNMPSCLAFDSEHKHLFVGCSNKLMVMMDVSNGKVLAASPIGVGADANAFDPDTQFVFSSCRDGTVTIAHEDLPDKLTTVQMLKTEPGVRSLVLDPKTHNIYLATAKSDKSSKIGSGSFKILVYGRESSK